jgi:hypothetical protein
VESIEEEEDEEEGKEEEYKSWVYHYDPLTK